MEVECGVAFCEVEPRHSPARTEGTPDDNTLTEDVRKVLLEYEHKCFDSCGMLVLPFGPSFWQVEVSTVAPSPSLKCSVFFHCTRCQPSPASVLRVCIFVR